MRRTWTEIISVGFRERDGERCARARLSVFAAGFAIRRVGFVSSAALHVRPRASFVRSAAFRRSIQIRVSLAKPRSRLRLRRLPAPSAALPPGAAFVAAALPSAPGARGPSARGPLWGTTAPAQMIFIL
ncbi:unnamed protein product [Lampetra planeri]